MEKIFKIQTRTASGQSCINAKRIYSDNLLIKWTCPDCNLSVDSEFNTVPLISYGNYCHCFYCNECGYESEPEEKMYKLHRTFDHYVEISFSGINESKAFIIETKLNELK